MDKDKRTPSIENIVKRLSYQGILSMLREQFTRTKLNIPENADEAVFESCKRLKNKHDAKRCELFDDTYNALLNKWESFKNNQPIQAFLDIRDKLTAHLELKMVNGSYQFTDISKLGLKWGDLRSVLSELKPIVLYLSLIIRNASIDIEYTESSFNKMASVFWAKDNIANCQWDHPDSIYSASIIVSEYGAVLDRTSIFTLGLSEKKLPYSKEQIETAIERMLKFLNNKKSLHEFKQNYPQIAVDVMTNRYYNALKTGYVELAKFLPDHEAEPCERASLLISKSHLQGKTFDEMIDELKMPWLEEVMQINKRISEDSSSRLQRLQCNFREKVIL